jgi:hypothetical protein
VSKRLRLAWLAGLPLAIAAAIVAWAALMPVTSEDRDQVFEIPKGTWARRMAGDMGVDRLSWELTDHPESAFSRRFVNGSAELEAIRHEVWDDNNLGNAIAGAVKSRSWPGRKPRPTFTATSASRSSFTGSMGVEVMR